MKTFFDGIFVSKEHLDEAGVKYPIKLEYYKIARDENKKESQSIEENENKYGIEIVKTEYIEGNVRVESKEINNVVNNVKDQEKILELLRNNEVTPVGVEDVLEDLLKI